MKKFDKLNDLKDYLKLSIIGSYGKGFTYTDLLIDLNNIRSPKSLYLPIYIVIRETGTQGIFRNINQAVDSYNRWTNSSKYIIEISYKEGYIVRTIYHA